MSALVPLSCSLHAKELLGPVCSQKTHICSLPGYSPQPRSLLLCCSYSQEMLCPLPLTLLALNSQGHLGSPVHCPRHLQIIMVEYVTSGSAHLSNLNETSWTPTAVVTLSAKAWRYKESLRLVFGELEVMRSLVVCDSPGL